MASRYELEVTVSSAKDLKNVNWRHGPTRPYAVVWVDPNNKCSTRVDDEGDMSPIWDQTLIIPLPPGPVEDAALDIDVVHAGSEVDTKPLIGSARLRLLDVLNEANFGEPLRRVLQLKRPSGRPHGKVEVKVCVRETRYRSPNPYRAPPYGVPPASREYAPPAYGNPYAPPPPNSYYAMAPPAGGYAYVAYDAPPPQYGQVPQYRYGGEPAAVHGRHRQEEEEANFQGMWTAVAVGVGVGVGALAGLALAAWLDSSSEENVDDDDEDEDEDDDGIVVDADEIVDDGPAEE